MDVPAYEIGVVFLLVALFMYGTSVSGFFPKVFGHGKAIAMVIAAIALAVVAVRYAPEAFEQARAMWIGRPEAEPKPPSPAIAVKPRAPKAGKPAPAPTENHRCRGRFAAGRAGDRRARAVRSPGAIESV